MLDAEDWGAPLTPRETEVVELVANGHSSKDVARRLGIAPRTVERHIDNVRLKMRARNRIQMVTLAVAEGVLTIEEGRATAAGAEEEEAGQFPLPLHRGG